MVAVTDYGVSFGDNYCIGGLYTSAIFPSETPYTLWPNPRVSRASAGPDIKALTPISMQTFPRPGLLASLRGMFDVNNGQTVRLASVTDGTSNTIAAGEGLPPSVPTTTFGNGILVATEPLFRSTFHPRKVVTLPALVGATNSNWSSRCAYTNTGFKSHHPGGGNFVFVDGSVHFLKQTIAMTPTVPWAAAPAARSSALTRTDGSGRMT